MVFCIDIEVSLAMTQSEREFRAPRNWQRRRNGASPRARPRVPAGLGSRQHVALGVQLRGAVPLDVHAQDPVDLLQALGDDLLADEAPRPRSPPPHPRSCPTRRCRRAFRCFARATRRAARDLRRGSSWLPLAVLARHSYFAISYCIKLYCTVLYC